MSGTIAQKHNPRATMKLAYTLALVMLAGGQWACEQVTAERIETWKGTVKGPEKLKDAFASSNVDPELRARAAIALSSLGQREFVAETLEKLPPEARGPVVAALIRLHLASLETNPDVAAVQDARDGLFGLRPYAAAEDRVLVDKALLGVIEKQAATKAGLGGSHSLGTIVEALGAQASPVLVKLLGQPGSAVADLAELLLKVGDNDARIAASTNLANQVRATKTVDSGAWRALGLLGGPDAVSYLKQQVDTGSWQTAEQAARALQLRPQPELGEFALKRAADTKLHGNVREEMFGLAASCCGSATLPGLVDLLSKAKDELVRYRAFDAALQVGGAQALEPALGAFPPGASFKPEDVADFLVKDTIGLGEGAREVVLKLLDSPLALKRMVGVQALQRLGTAADVPRLQQMSSEKGLVKGFPATQTVGREAGRVATLLAKRA